MIEYRRNFEVIILLAVFVVLAGLYSLMTPAFEGPDSGGHFRYIAYLQQTQHLPGLNGESAAFSHELVQQPPFYYAIAALASAGTISPEALDLDQVNPYYQRGLSHRATFTPPKFTLLAELPIYIAKFIALLGGLLTVLGSWLCLRVLLPDQPSLALAVAGVVGLNPQFLFSAGTITNDTWAAAMFVWAIALGIYSAQRATRPLLGWLLTGLCAGLAALTKYSGLLVMLPLGLIWLSQWRKTNWRHLVPQLLLLLAGFLITAGFWYLNNLMETGSLTPLQTIFALLPGLVRPAPLAYFDPKLWQEVRWLLRSYWGVFGYGIVAPAGYHWIIQNVLGIALLGLCVLPIRWTLVKQTSQWALLGLAWLWFGVIFASLVQWIHLMYAANQGRLLFPAAPAIAILVVLGWQAWLPIRWHPALHRLLTLLFLGLAISQLFTVYDSYRMPAALTPPLHYDREIQASFEGGMQVLGVDLPEGAAIHPGKPMPLTIYFTTQKEISDFYTLFIHLADEHNQLLYQYDGVPAQGRHPTRQWMPGMVFADTYWLDSKLPAHDVLATLSLGFYNYQDANRRQLVLGPDGAMLGDRLLVTRVHVDAEPPPEPLVSVPLARWENGIQLLSAKLEQNSDGRPLLLNVAWQTTQVIQTDYTVFVQSLDSAGHLLAQVDQQPQAGRFPTSTWQNSDVIHDVYSLGSPNAPWQKIIIGFYDAQQHRLLLQTDEGSHDFYVLAQRDTMSNR
ncbi:MAG: hypothetical protein NT075_03445 [Chloroflexi bacterium]|nr:hypothetical protein [Chloroflexota bacterium]